MKVLSDTFLYPNINYGYFHSMTFTFLRPSKAIKRHNIAQLVGFAHMLIPDSVT